MSKVVLIHKKGSKNNIKNSRLVANLCSATKIFDKLILKQINYLETENKLGFNRKQQHGFKKNKSNTTTCKKLLVSKIYKSNYYLIVKTLESIIC
jgi:hypothetical protein